MFDVIIEAARQLRTVNIVYLKKDGSVVEHEVEPYSVRGNLFYGWRVDVGEIRAFLIDNIMSATITDNMFIPRFPVEL